jgi:DNA-binding MarR family transcriptional regulator
MSAPPVEPFQRTTSTQSSGDDTEWAAAVVDDAARALVAIVEAAREQARTRLSTSQLEALLVVEDKEGLNLGALAERMGVLLSSASRLCDRLVAAGMLERAASPVDRREVILTLTANGRALLEDLRADRRGRIAAVLGLMTPTARAAVVRGLREFTHAAGVDAQARTDAA